LLITVTYKTAATIKNLDRLVAIVVFNPVETCTRSNHYP